MFKMMEKVRTPDGDGLVVGLPDLDQYEVRTERGLRIWKKNQIQSLEPKTVTKGDDPIPYMLPVTPYPPKSHQETDLPPLPNKGKINPPTPRDSRPADKNSKTVVTPEGKVLHGIAARKYKEKQDKQNQGDS